MSVERGKVCTINGLEALDVSVTGSVRSQRDFTAVVLFEKANLFRMADRVDIATDRRTF